MNQTIPTSIRKTARIADFFFANVKDGERRNGRLVDGWKNSGQPWSDKLDKAKMYFSH